MLACTRKYDNSVYVSSTISDIDFFKGKEDCNEIFDFRFFHESVTPGHPEFPIGAISNSYKNSWRYSHGISDIFLPRVG